MANNGVSEEAPVMNFPSAKGLSAGWIHPENDEEEGGVNAYVEVSDGTHYD